MAVSPSKRFLLVAFLLLCFLSINATGELACVLPN